MDNIANLMSRYPILLWANDQSTVKPKFTMASRKQVRSNTINAFSAALMCGGKMEFITCAHGGLKLYYWDIFTHKKAEKNNSMGVLELGPMQ